MATVVDRIENNNNTHIRRRLTLNIAQTTQNVNKGFEVCVDQLSFDLNTFERVIIALLDRIEVVVILATRETLLVGIEGSRVSYLRRRVGDG